MKLNTKKETTEKLKKDSRTNCLLSKKCLKTAKHKIEVMLRTLLELSI